MYRIIRSADDYALPFRDQVQWVIDNLGYSERDAYSLVDDIEYYTDRGFHGIHNQNFDDYCQLNEPASRNLDRMLNHPNMPKYKGVCYRGLKWSLFDSEGLEKILNSGIWKEPGITSFSTSKEDAAKFASVDSLHNPIMITLLNNRHGCEIGFLSQGGGEGEVLYPSIIAERGLKIVDWYKDTIYGQRISKKTGKPIVVHENYFVTCKDW